MNTTIAHDARPIHERADVLQARRKWTDAQAGLGLLLEREAWIFQILGDGRSLRMGLLERLHAKAGTMMPPQMRRARELFSLAARGVAPSACIERCGYVAAWCEWPRRAGGPTPDERDDLVREFCRIPNEITMPNALVSDQQWRQFEGLGVLLGDAEKDQAAYLAGPPAVDVAYRDAYPEIDRHEFEFARGVWGERPPRGAGAQPVERGAV